jgi:hypothetical protein
MRATRWPAPYSSTASVKSATAVGSSSATGPAALVVTTASLLWSTVFLALATNVQRSHDQAVDDTRLQYLPLGCEYINLTGDCLWRPNVP